MAVKASAGWQTLPLGEVIQLEYGKPLAGEDRKPDGRYPVYGANGEIDRTDKHYWAKPSIIVGRKGSAGEVNLSEPRFWPLDVTYFVTFDERKHSLKFLYHLLTLLDLPSLAKGIKPGINRNEVYDKIVALPPLPEQQRIVGILDEAFAAIGTAKANAAKNLSNARALFESHLQAVFTQRGVNWSNVRLGEVVDRLTNGYVGPTRGIYHETGVPYLLARHVKHNRLTFDGRTHITDTFNRKHKKSMLKAGDVLLVQSGHVGHSAVVPEEHAGHNCHAMIVISPKPHAITGPFLSTYFSSPSVQRQFEGMHTGSTLKHLNCRDVKEMSVPCPSLVEQGEVVSCVDSLRVQTHRLESLTTQKLAALDALKKSLLHQAFTGQLSEKPEWMATA